MWTSQLHPFSSPRTGSVSDPLQTLLMNGGNFALSDANAFTTNLTSLEAAPTAHQYFQSNANLASTAILRDLLKAQSGQISSAQMNLNGPFSLSDESELLKSRARFLQEQLLMNSSLPNNTATTQMLIQNPGLNYKTNNSVGVTFANRDFAPPPLPTPWSKKKRGGVLEPFPEKLQRLLQEVEAAGRSDVISYVNEGCAFKIHKPEAFFQEIVPHYFRQSRLSSFKRQLNLYGFELITTGPARGSYFHESFVRDQPELCRKMRRILPATKRLR